ncbi:MAG: hypothetical protein C0421_01285 [Hyphomonas sp.]|nr:hypothetical protein [Hyphomonas sp.]
MSKHFQKPISQRSSSQRKSRILQSLLSSSEIERELLLCERKSSIPRNIWITLFEEGLHAFAEIV